MAQHGEEALCRHNFVRSLNMVGGQSTQRAVDCDEEVLCNRARCHVRRSQQSANASNQRSTSQELADSPDYGSPSAGFRRIPPDAVELLCIHLKATDVCRYPNSKPNTRKREDHKREGLLRRTYIGIPVLGQWKSRRLTCFTGTLSNIYVSTNSS